MQVGIEVWKDIINYEGVYQVSDHGRIKSLAGVFRPSDYIFQLSKTTQGYRDCVLRKNGKSKSFRVHMLVMRHFIGERPTIEGQLAVIDHIDEDKANNNLSNLRYISNRENCSRTVRGSSEYTGVYWNKQKNKYHALITINKKPKHLGYFKDELLASDAYQTALRELL